MIVDQDGGKMNPSTVAKALFYYYGQEMSLGDVERKVFDFTKATDREMGLIDEQCEIVRTRMSKQLLGK